MASYVYSGDSELVFPTLVGADGAVITVAKGDKFEGPDGILALGVSVVSGKTSKTVVELEATEAVEPEVTVED